MNDKQQVQNEFIAAPRELSAAELLAVAGGPQVINDSVITEDPPVTSVAP